MKPDYRQLPQLCCRCGNGSSKGFLRPAASGQFFRSRKSHRKPVWVCNDCLQRPVRLNRAGQESPLERDVRSALMTFGEYFVCEFELDHFLYDFAFPSLRLLMEADSYTYHHTRKTKITDARKHKVAEAHGWKLVRVMKSANVGKKACALVRERRLELIRQSGLDEEEVRMFYQERYGAGGN
jgi:very-short-patch-repair endonuclease